jgi:NifU-like protein involved in Fe-S cluster formation
VTLNPSLPVFDKMLMPSAYGKAVARFYLGHALVMSFFAVHMRDSRRPLAKPAGPVYIIHIMLNEIYNKRILELAANIPHLGRLPQADASATAHSRLCGSTVTVDITMDDHVVTGFAHDVKACALGQASSSIMARHVLGSTASELRLVRDQIRAMLKENGAAPTGKWADIEVLSPVRDYKARHASTLLTFDAVVDAIGQIETRQGNNIAAE